MRSPLVGGRGHSSGAVRVYLVFLLPYGEDKHITTRAKQPTGRNCPQMRSARFFLSNVQMSFCGGGFGSTISCHPQKEQ